MNIKNNILKFISILCLLFPFQSCKKLSDENINVISIPNDSIKGQDFIGESSSAVKYSPKGNFIKVIKPDSGIWTNLRIEKSNQKIDSKLFFHDDDINVSIIYDSLSLGEYNLKFISDLKDTISEKLNFKKNIELRFPNKLQEYYKEKDIKHLNIDKLTKNDTLQVIYKNFGCFGGSENLIEFIRNENNEITLRKKINGVRYEDEPEDEWIYSKKKNVKENLKRFVNNIKKIDKNDENYCSSQIEYIFRIKGKNKIYWVKDKSCEFSNEISEIINTR
ncbi:hypothetical protein [Tenacibaculum halocynthiae]|uniref:hypothetical protein n=1 Tax=Tenacibaculum halocynthiae TaxID=1254437 RepID=UPI0038958F4F